MPESDPHPNNALFTDPTMASLTTRPEVRHLIQTTNSRVASRQPTADEIDAQEYDQQKFKVEAIARKLRDSRNSSDRARILAEHPELCPEEARAIMGLKSLEKLREEHSNRMSEIHDMQRQVQALSVKKHASEDIDDGADDGNHSLRDLEAEEFNQEDDSADVDGNFDDTIHAPSASAFEHLQRENKAALKQVSDLQRALVEAEQRCAEAEHTIATRQARYAATEEKKERLMSDLKKAEKEAQVNAQKISLLERHIGYGGRNSFSEMFSSLGRSSSSARGKTQTVAAMPSSSANPKPPPRTSTSSTSVIPSQRKRFWGSLLGRGRDPRKSDDVPSSLPGASPAILDQESTEEKDDTVRTFSAESSTAGAVDDATQKQQSADVASGLVTQTTKPSLPPTPPSASTASAKRTSSTLIWIPSGGKIKILKDPEFPGTSAGNGSLKEKTKTHFKNAKKVKHKSGFGSTFTMVTLYQLSDGRGWVPDFNRDDPSCPLIEVLPAADEEEEEEEEEPVDMHSAASHTQSLRLRSPNVDLLAAGTRKSPKRRPPNAIGRSPGRNATPRRSGTPGKSRPRTPPPKGGGGGGGGGQPPRQQETLSPRAAAAARREAAELEKEAKKAKAAARRAKDAERSAINNLPPGAWLGDPLFPPGAPPGPPVGLEVTFKHDESDPTLGLVTVATPFGLEVISTSGAAREKHVPIGSYVTCVGGEPLQAGFTPGATGGTNATTISPQPEEARRRAGNSTGKGEGASSSSSSHSSVGPEPFPPPPPTEERFRTLIQEILPRPVKVVFQVEAAHKAVLQHRILKLEKDLKSSEDRVRAMHLNPPERAPPANATSATSHRDGRNGTKKKRMSLAERAKAESTRAAAKKRASSRAGENKNGGASDHKNALPEHLMHLTSKQKKDYLCLVASEAAGRADIEELKWRLADQEARAELAEEDAEEISGLLAEAHESTAETRRRLETAQSQLSALQSTAATNSKALEIMRVKDERLEFFEKEVIRLRSEILSLANAKGDCEQLKAWLSTERSTHDKHMKTVQQLCAKLTQDVAERDRKCRTLGHAIAKAEKAAEKNDAAAENEQGAKFCTSLLMELVENACYYADGVTVTTRYLGTPLPWANEAVRPSVPVRDRVEGLRVTRSAVASFPSSGRGGRLLGRKGKNDQTKATATLAELRLLEARASVNDSQLELNAASPGRHAKSASGACGCWSWGSSNGSGSLLRGAAVQERSQLPKGGISELVALGDGEQIRSSGGEGEEEGTRL